MCEPPNVSGSTGLPARSTNPSGNTWNIIHDQPVGSGYGTNGDVATYNGYPVIPSISGTVNSNNTPYAQQSPITAMGGPTYTYVSQNMSSQHQKPYTPIQTAYPQPSAHNT